MPSSPRRNSGTLLVEGCTSPTDHDFDNYDAHKTFMFPGQGAQYVGMASEAINECPKAKELFTKASSILEYDLLELCLKGPKSKLDKTEICQPATFVHSMAAIEKLRMIKGNAEADAATAALGLSLGEYSALCYAGSISFEDCVRITKERGAAMQAAADKEKSGMISVIGLKIDQIEKMIDSVFNLSGERMWVANYLCEGNYVVSGSEKACKFIEKIAKPEFNARLTVQLPVAGAFHTEYMEPAVERLNTILDSVEIKKPRIPVISNVDGNPHSDPEVIRTILKKQIISPVLWERSMKNVLKHNYESCYELGPGTVLKGILMRIDQPKAKTVTNIA